MISTLLYTLGVVIFVFSILVSIALHELGHMIPAKKFGAKVTQYFIGFGPTVWSIQRGETEYGIKAFPLGGYVKIVGMLPPNKNETLTDDGLRIRKSNTGLFTQIISDAKSIEYETVKAEDYNRLFYKLPWYKKLAVMAGGPSVNILIAFFCFWGLFGLYGYQEVDAKAGVAQIADVSDCIIPYNEPARECTGEDKVSPAKAAGLQANDVVTSINGEPVEDWAKLTQILQTSTADKLELGVLRDGQELTLEAIPLKTLWPTDAGDVEERSVLGIAPNYEVTFTKGGPVYTIKWMGGQVVYVAESIANLPPKVVNVFLSIFGIEERDPNGPVSVVGGSRFAGETVAAAPEDVSASNKVAFLVSIIGGFNLFIGIFNFLPILPLDGGHMAGALWEGLRERLARLFNKPDPGPVDIAKMLPIAQVFGYALFVLGVVLIIGDFVAPIRLS